MIRFTSLSFTALNILSVPPILTLSEEIGFLIDLGTEPSAA
tara:strand:- start:4630 stop:4752 length:123 start_codon:yes stop_codon:yes gene_type:complete